MHREEIEHSLRVTNANNFSLRWSCSKIFYFILSRKFLGHNKLASKSLYKWKWPWIHYPPTFAIQVLEIQICTTIPGFDFRYYLFQVSCFTEESQGWTCGESYTECEVQLKQKFRYLNTKPIDMWAAIHFILFTDIWSHLFY